MKFWQAMKSLQEFGREVRRKDLIKSIGPSSIQGSEYEMDLTCDWVLCSKNNKSSVDWISVKENMPEPGQNVLLCYVCSENETRHIAMGFLDTTNPKYDFWNLFSWELPLRNVTHWCFLPNIPESVELPY